MLILRLFWAYFRLFWGPMTVQNLPMELTFSEYALVWVREQNRAFIFDFWEICDFFPVGSHFSPFSVTLRSFWTTFSRSSYSWGHPGTPVWTPKSKNDLSAANSLQPAQSESFREIRDTSLIHCCSQTHLFFSKFYSMVRHNPHLFFSLFYEI